MFNLKRFWNYAKRDFYYSKNWYLGIIGAWLGLFLLTIVFHYFNYERISDMFMGMTLAAPMIFFFIAPFVIEEKRYKKQAIFSNILPASNFEKYLHFWLKYVVVIHFAFWGIAFLIMQIYRVLINPNLKLFSLTIADFTYQFFNFYVYIIMGFHSLCLLGYYFFKKNALVKTAISLFAIYIIYSFAIKIAEEIFYAININDVHFIEFFRPTSVYNWLEIPVPLLANVIYYIFRIIFPFGIWFATYFKMKETEI